MRARVRAVLEGWRTAAELTGTLLLAVSELVGNVVRHAPGAPGRMRVANLLSRLGLSHLFGSTPRVHFEADYRARLWFGEAVRTELRVTRVGASSLHYAFTVLGEEGTPAATGRMVIAHSAARATGATPWPADVRDVLTKAGPRAPELITGTPGGTPCA